MYSRFSCCRGPVDDEFHGEGDNSCGWNMEAIRKQTSLANSDFVYVSFKSEVCIKANSYVHGCTYVLHIMQMMTYFNTHLIVLW